jgi:hypothetical protein
MPHYTLYLAELARRVGGQLYFLREIGNLSDDLSPHRADHRRAVHAGLLSIGGNRSGPAGAHCAWSSFPCAVSF